MATTPSLPGLLNPQGLSVGRGARCVLEGKEPPFRLVPNPCKLGGLVANQLS